jgi:hypothetical protein
MSELQPFSGPDVHCPKCHGDVMIEFYPAGTVFLPPSLVRLQRGASEWLLRRCSDCGYAWSEACADEHAATMFQPQEDGRP